MVLVELLNLTFENQPSRNRDLNVKFAPGKTLPAFHLGRSTRTGAIAPSGAIRGPTHLPRPSKRFIGITSTKGAIFRSPLNPIFRPFAEPARVLNRGGVGVGDHSQHCGSQFKRVAERAVLPVFAGTLFVSAVLLFSVQPMFTKMVLPLLGGSPSVWSVAMVFFQAVLLAGYAYAHGLTRWLSPGRAVIVHLIALRACRDGAAACD